MLIILLLNFLPDYYVKYFYKRIIIINELLKTSRHSGFHVIILRLCPFFTFIIC